MILSSGTKRPKIDPSSYVASTATVSGDVTIGAGCAILHGAVLVAEGAPLTLGAECVIMENAVVKASGGSIVHFPTSIGARCIVGPHAYIVGASIGTGCFIAAGAQVINGTTLEAHSSVPKQHIAFGNPAVVLGPEQAAAIEEKSATFEAVFNLAQSDDVRAQAARTYAKFLRSTHAQDAPVGDGTHRTKAPKQEPEVAVTDGVVDAMMLELQRMESLRKKKR